MNVIRQFLIIDSRIGTAKSPSVHRFDRAWISVDANSPYLVGNFLKVLSVIVGNELIVQCTQDTSVHRERGKPLWNRQKSCGLIR